MRIERTLVSALVILATAVAQSDRGIVTGTVTDPGGAVVSKAPLEVRNVDTGSVFQAATSETGNYSFPQLPVGLYELSVSVPGFKKYVRPSLQVGVAQTMRVDIVLEIGATSETLTVMETTPLLKTESGELSHNVETKRLIDLPVLALAGAAGGSGAIRSPLSSAQTIPGTTQTNAIVRVNGAPGNSQSIRIDGQDATNIYIPFSAASTQPSVDAIQEVSIQTSNFAAEYGQVGGGLFNFTMKSGTNQYHGILYDYMRNEALEAGQAWSDDGTGKHIRALSRQHNYGFNVGGPIWIPKIYDGHNKSFFFFNLDKFMQRSVEATQALTVPTAAFRVGNFAGIQTQVNNRVIGTDLLGRQIIENTIYDPATQAAGSTTRNPFPGNVIPANRMDPVSLKIQGMIPSSATTDAINNLTLPYQNPSDIKIPSVKLDQSFGSAHKLSFYWTLLALNAPRQPGAPENEGLPLPITSGRPNNNGSFNVRLNYDYTLSPTTLLHLGGGFQTYSAWDTALSVPYDAAKELGIPGIPVIRQFPKFTGLESANFGGMEAMGPGSQAVNKFLKPSGTASLTWVKSNHTYRFGGEFRTEGVFRQTFTSTAGLFDFNSSQTSLPSTQGQNLMGGALGFAYASFLLGHVNSLSAAMPAVPRVGKHSVGLYVQDTWKITRTLTLDYGLRYDYQTSYREQYGRMPVFSPTAPSALFGGRLGSMIYEGNGPGQCQCSLSSNYPFAFGPRLGVAYQITPKTVLRGGFGVVYSATNVGGAGTALGLGGTVSQLAAGSAGVNLPVTTLSAGIPLKPVWPNFDPGVIPFNGAPTFIDPNAGRPARQLMWSIGLQRQLWSNMVVEASYVANRGVWWQANALNQINGVGQARLAQFGLDVTKQADRDLLVATVGSALAINRGFGGRPYSGFPATQQVIQALRPFPQYGNITNLWSPLGSTWYDSLQVKATQRFYHGFDFTYAFTWQKELALGVACEQCIGGAAPVINDPFNRDLNKQLSAYSQPLIATFAGNYTTPRLNTNRIVSQVARDWLVGAFLSYSSGTPIAAPGAQNALGNVLRGVTANSSRIPGVPLFTKDLNCHCFDPGQEFVLNPAAWQDPAAGFLGTTAAFFNDYRIQRRPQENAALSRTFAFTERLRLMIRFEMQNVFNRLRVPLVYTSTNALAVQSRRAADGVTLAGFGRINTLTPATGQRTAQLMARFTF